MRVARTQWEYTLRQAAQLCSVSVDTIKRRLRAGDLPHARKLDDAARTWVVPLGDLVAAGFTVTPRTSLQARTDQRGVDLDVQVAVADALEKVHADYARRFAGLAARAVDALAVLAASAPQTAAAGSPGAVSAVRLPEDDIT